MATKKWEMPAWMEPYRQYICNTGGNSVESMVNGNASPLVNLPLSTLQACVKSQVGLLEKMHEAGAIADSPDMIAALETIAEQAPTDEPGPASFGRAAWVFGNIARAAIAKTKGGA